MFARDSWLLGNVVRGAEDHREAAGPDRGGASRQGGGAARAAARPADGGAEGVGKATIQAVVYSYMMIIISDYFLTYLFQMFGF